MPLVCHSELGSRSLTVETAFDPAGVAFWFCAQAALDERKIGWQLV